MTEEEARNLKPGDKIIFIGHCQGFNDFLWIQRLFRTQEENGGYLTFTNYCEGRISVLEIEGTHLFLEETELYQEPNRPWSYELDY
jgi:hypothetical protein